MDSLLSRTARENLSDLALTIPHRDRNVGLGTAHNHGHHPRIVYHGKTTNGRCRERQGSRHAIRRYGRQNMLGKGTRTNVSLRLDDGSTRQVVYGRDELQGPLLCP